MISYSALYNGLLSLPPNPAKTGLFTLEFELSEKLKEEPLAHINNHIMTVTKIGGTEDNPVYKAEYEVTVQDTQGTANIQISVTDIAENNTQIIEQSIVIDTIQPIITINNALPNPAKSGLLILEFESSEKLKEVPVASINNQSMTVSKIGGTEFNPIYKAEYEITNQDTQGTANIQISVIDPADNITQITDESVVIDTIQPVITINSVLPNPTKTGLLTLEFEISEKLKEVPMAEINGQTMSVSKINGSENNPVYKAEYEITAQDTQGTANILISVKDTAGNAAQITDEQVVIDTIQPVITINSALPNPTKTGLLTLEFELSEKLKEVPIAQINSQAMVVTRTGGTENNPLYNAEYQITDQDTQGTADIGISVTDLAGNITQISDNNVLIDTVKPVISINSTSPNPAKTGLLTLEYEISEQLKSLPAVQINSQAMATTRMGGTETNPIYKSEYDITQEDTQGTADIQISVTDLADNVSQITDQNLVIDTIKPVVTINTASPNPAKTGLLTIEFGVSEELNEIPLASINGKTMSVTKLAGSPNNPIYKAEYNITGSDTQGTADIQISVMDTAQNNAQIADDSVIIDTIQPVITISTVLPNPAKIGLFSIEFGISEELKTLPLAQINAQAMFVTRIGGSDNSPTYKAEYTITNQEDQGLANIQIDVADIANNTSQIIDNSVVIDTVQPIINIISTFPNPVKAGILNIEFEVSEKLKSMPLAHINNKMMSVTKIGGSESNPIYNAEYEVTNQDTQGTANIQISVKDEALNVTQIIDNPNIVIDTIQPVITINSALPNPTKIGLFTLEFEVSEKLKEVPMAQINSQAMTVTKIGGTENNPLYKAEHQITDQDNQGTADIQISVKDLAENSAQILNQSVVIDTIDPIININSILPNPTKMGLLTLEFESSEKLKELPVASINNQSMTVTKIVGIDTEYKAEYQITQEEIQGTANIQISVIDNANNTAQISNSSLVIDTIKPNLSDSISVISDTGTLYLDNKTFIINFTESIKLDRANNKIILQDNNYNHELNIAGNFLENGLYASIQAEILREQLTDFSGQADLRLTGFKDEAGNLMSNYQQTFEVDNILPEAKAVTMDIVRLGVIEQLNSGEVYDTFKVSEGKLRFTVGFSEQIENPQLELQTEVGNFQAILLSNSGLESEFDINLDKGDFDLAVDKNQIRADIKVFGNDPAGNEIETSLIDYSFIMDFEAPLVVSHSSGRGYIKPYDIEGEENTITLNFVLSEIGLDPQISVYKVGTQDFIKSLVPVYKGESAEENHIYESIWDGKDSNNHLVGLDKEYFYEVRIKTQDRAGNEAETNLTGHIKVKHCEIGVYLTQRPSIPISIINSESADFDYSFSIFNEELKSDQDFEDQYGTPMVLFSQAAQKEYGAYTLSIYPENDPDNPVFFQDTNITEPLTKSLQWDGKFDDNYQDQLKRGQICPDGTYIIEIRATDNAQNSATHNVITQNTFILDNSQPVLNANRLTVRSDGFTTKKQPSNLASFSAIDNLDTNPVITYKTGNLIQNPGFELFNGNGTALNYSVSGLYTDVEWKKATQDIKTGRFLQKLIYRHGRNIGIYQRVTVEPNINYIFNGSIKANSTNMAIKIGKTALDGTYLNFNSSGQNQWQNAKTIFNTGSETEIYVSLVCLSDAISGDLGIEAIIDDFSLVKTDSDWQPELTNISNFKNDGQKTIWAKAVDQAGNTTFNMVPVIIDTTINQPQNISLAPQDWTSKNIFAFSWTEPWDSSGIKEAYFKIGSKPANTGQGTAIQSGAGTTITNLVQGENPAYIWLKDSLDNEGWQNPVAVTINFDTTIPTCSATGSLAIWQSAWPQIDRDFQDNGGSGFAIRTFQWNNDSPRNYDADFYYPSDGEHTLKLYCLDNAGNSALWSSDYLIDTTTPIISNIAVIPQLSKAGTVTINFTISEPIPTDPIVKINGNNLTVSKTTGDTNYQAIYQVTSSDTQGEAVITIQAQDKAGNPTIIEGGIPVLTIDTIQPAINHESITIQPSDLPYYQSKYYAKADTQVRLTLPVSEQVQENSISANGGNYANVANITYISQPTPAIQLDLTYKANGAVDITVSFEDIAGNTNQYTYSEIKTDASNPSLADLSVNDAGVLCLSDKVFTLNFNEPVTKNAQTKVYMKQETNALNITKVNDTTYQAALQENQMLNFSNTETLSIQSFTDIAGNPMPDYTRSYDIDIVAPIVTNISLQPERLAASKPLSNFQDDSITENYKVGTGWLDLEITFSEPVSNPRLRLEAGAYQKEASFMSMTNNTASFRIYLDINDWPQENDLTAYIIVFNALDNAGNIISEANQDFTFIMDFKAPVIEDHGADNHITINKSDPYYGLIKPYDISGQAQTIDLWFDLTEPALLPEITVREATTNVLVRSFSPDSIIVEDGFRYKFTWDGRDNSGKLAGSEKTKKFYYVQINTKDRAGNEALTNLGGYIRVQHQDLGVYIKPITSVPFSPALEQNVNFDLEFKIENYDVPDQQDFENEYPGNDYVLFSTPQPKYGKYNLKIYPQGQPSNIVYQAQDISITQVGNTVTKTWNGHVDNDPQKAVCADGTYVIEVHAWDNADNAATHNVQGETHTFVLDKTGPNLSAFNLAKEFTNQLNVNFARTVGDNIDSVEQLTFYYKIDSGSWLATQNLQVILDTRETSQTVSYYAKDRAGNSSAVVSDIITYDVTLPNAEIIFNNGFDLTNYDRTVSSNLDIQVNVTETNLDSYSVQFDDIIDSSQTQASKQFVFDTQAKANQSYNLVIQMLDKAGNINTVSKTVMIDTTPPSIQLQSLADYIKNPQIQVEVTGIQDVNYPVTLYYAQDSSSYQLQNSFVNTSASYQFNKDITGADGNKLIKIKAVDRLGNYVELNDSLLLDTVLPIVNADKSTSSWYTNEIGAITLTASDSNTSSGLAAKQYRWSHWAENVWADFGAQNQIAIQIEREGINTLNIKAVDNAGNESMTWQGIYKQDTSKPVVSAQADNAPSASGWYRVSIGNITLSVSDQVPGSGLVNKQYSWDGINWTDFENGNKINIDNEGVNHLKLRAQDAAGNEAVIWEGDFKQDTSIPAVSADKSKAQGEWYNTVIGSITLSVSDESAGSGFSQKLYRWEHWTAGRWEPFADNDQITIEQEGANTLTLKAIDIAGNERTWQGYYNQDTAQPAANGSPQGSDWPDNLTEIQLFHSDPSPGSGVAYAKYRWDNSDVDNGQIFTNGTTIPALEGEHTLYVRVWDNAGNINGWVGTYKLDTQAPSCEATGAYGNWQTSWPTITPTFTDPAGGAPWQYRQYKWDNGSWQNWQSGNITPPSDGEHTLYLICKDVAGNISVMWSGNYDVDTQAPEAYVVNPPDWQQSWSTITPICSDEGGSEVPEGNTYYRWDDNIWISFSESIQNGFPMDGIHNLYIKLIDVAGNESINGPFTYKVDTLDPSCAVNPPAGYQNFWPANFNVTFNDGDNSSDDSGLYSQEWSWDSVNWYSTSLPITKPSGDGTHTLYVRCEDRSGRTAWAQGNYLIDQTPPHKCEADNHANGNWQHSWPTITAYFEEALSGLSNPQYKWEDGTWVNSSNGAEIPRHPYEGEHTLYLRCWDNAGNYKEWNQKYRVDSQKPEVIVSPPNYDWQNINSPIELEARDPDSSHNSGINLNDTKYRWNNNDVANGIKFTPGIKINVPGEGEHTLYVQTRDNANWISDPVSGVFRYDATPPSITDFKFTKEGISKTDIDFFYPRHTIAASEILNEIVGNGILGFSCKVQDNCSSQINYKFLLYRDTTLIKEYTQAAVNNGNYVNQTTTGHNDSSEFLQEGSYTLKIWIQDAASNSQTITLSQFQISYYKECSDYTYSFGELFQYYSPLGIYWAVVPFDNKVDIRKSIDGINWSNEYTYTCQGKIVDVCSTVGLGGVQVYLTDTATDKKIHIYLPYNHENLNTYPISLSDGYLLDVYEVEPNSKTWFNNRVGSVSGVIKNKKIWFTNSQGSDVFYSSDWFGTIIRGFIKIPANVNVNKFRIQCDDGGRLWFNGKLIISRTGVGAYAGTPASIEPGGIYPFILWLTEMEGDSWITLEYYENDVYKGYVPASWFYQDIHWGSESMLEGIMNSWQRGIRHYVYTGHWWERLSYVYFRDNVSYSWPTEHMSDYHSFMFYAKETGDYKFFQDSDDGSEFMLDSVVMNPGELDCSAHGHHYHTVHLERGLHSIRFRHIQDRFGNLVDLRYLNPGETGTYKHFNASTSGVAYHKLNGDIEQITYALMSMPGEVILLNNPVVTQNNIILISPTQNQQVLTNKPTFIWQFPSSNIDTQYNLEFYFHDDAEPNDEDSFNNDNSVNFRKKALLPSEINKSNKDQTIMSHSPSWKDTFSPGYWRWQVALKETPASTVIKSNSAGFEVVPGLEIEGVINYPNPFRETTKIRYKLSKEADEVTIYIYSAAGKLVRELDGETRASSVSQEYHDILWDSKNDYGEKVVNGVYLYKIIASSEDETKECRGKMIKLR